MSAKYNEHPMEQKAEAGIAANRHDRDKRSEAYKRWHAWYYQSSEQPPTSEEAFNAGWTERATPPASEIVPEGTIAAIDKISDELDVMLSNSKDETDTTWRNMANDHLERMILLLDRIRATQNDKETPNAQG